MQYHQEDNEAVRRIKCMQQTDPAKMWDMMERTDKAAFSQIRFFVFSAIPTMSVMHQCLLMQKYIGAYLFHDLFVVTSALRNVLTNAQAIVDGSSAKESVIPIFDHLVSETVAILKMPVVDDEKYEDAVMYVMQGACDRNTHAVKAAKEEAKRAVKEEAVERKKEAAELKEARKLGFTSVGVYRQHLAKEAARAAEEAKERQLEQELAKSDANFPSLAASSAKPAASAWAKGSKLIKEKPKEAKPVEKPAVRSGYTFTQDAFPVLA